MQRLRSPLLLICVVLAVGACASAGGAGTSAVWRQDLGRVLLGPLEEVRLKIWGKHAIPLQRDERSSRSVLYESQWMPRDVTPAEAAGGVLEARNRVVLEGRYLEGSLDTSGVYRATFTVQNEVRSEIVPEWHPATIPEAAIARYRPVYSDMRLELQTGVRR